MLWAALQQCVESDQSDAAFAEISRRQVIEDTWLAARQDRNAWLAARGREGKVVDNKDESRGDRVAVQQRASVERGWLRGCTRWWRKVRWQSGHSELRS